MVSKGLCLQRPIIIAYGSERVENTDLFRRELVCTIRTGSRRNCFYFKDECMLHIYLVCLTHTRICVKWSPDPFAHYRCPNKVLPCNSYRISRHWIMSTNIEGLVRMFGVTDWYGPSQFPFSCIVYHLGRPMRKCVFGHMRTAKAQISLRICAVLSGPSMSATIIIGYYRMYEWKAKAQMIFRAAQDDLNLRNLRMCKGIFLLDAANIYVLW